MVYYFFIFYFLFFILFTKTPNRCRFHSLPSVRSDTSLVKVAGLVVAVLAVVGAVARNWVARKTVADSTVIIDFCLNNPLGWVDVGRPKAAKCALHFGLVVAVAAVD